jgi:hypothetical protein
MAVIQGHRILEFKFLLTLLPGIHFSSLPNIGEFGPSSSSKTLVFFLMIHIIKQATATRRIHGQWIDRCAIRNQTTVQKPFIQ